MTGEPVVTFQDHSIDGHVDEGGHLLITAAAPGAKGIYSYDPPTGDFVRLSTSTSPVDYSCKGRWPTATSCGSRAPARYGVGADDRARVP